MDVVEWMSHGQRGDIVDVHTVIPWPLLCAEIVKLNVTLPVTNGNANGAPESQPGAPEAVATPIETAPVITPEAPKPTHAEASAEGAETSEKTPETEGVLDESCLQSAYMVTQLADLTGGKRVSPAGFEPAYPP